MSAHREEKIAEQVKHLIAEYISKESNRLSLITVTNLALSEKLDKASIMVTVLPETSEKDAMAFLKRQSTEIREHIRKNLKVHTIPFLTFFIDKGEKNRQKIDELSKTI